MIRLSEQSVVGGQAVQVMTSMDIVPIERGGTGQVTAQAARVALDVLGLNDTANVNGAVTFKGAVTFTSDPTFSSFLTILLANIGTDGLILATDGTNYTLLRPSSLPLVTGTHNLIFASNQSGRIATFVETSGAAGDMIYRSSNDDQVSSRLPIGASGKLLRSNGSAPQWADAATVKVDLTGQTGNIATTNLVTGASGPYLVSVIQTCTTAGTAGTLTTTIGWTDENGTQTATPAAGLTLAGTGFDDGHEFVYCASGNLTYSTTLAGALGNPQYSLHIQVLKL